MELRYARWKLLTVGLVDSAARRRQVDFITRKCWLYFTLPWFANGRVHRYIVLQTATLTYRGLTKALVEDCYTEFRLCAGIWASLALSGACEKELASRVVDACRRIAFCRGGGQA